jgi:hypothetical protein
MAAFLISQSSISVPQSYIKPITSNRTPKQVSDRAPVIFISSSSYDMIDLSLSASSSGSCYRTIDMPVTTRRYETDPEIAAMTDEELLAETKRLFGAWADLDEDWRDDIWSRWDLSRILDDDQNSSSLST